MKWLILFLSFNAVAGIGEVSDTKGNGCQIERNKSKLPGEKGSAIESMDTYTTTGCVGNITFKDNTKVKINENSRLLIDDFVFDPKQSDAGKLALKVGLGTVRYASGQIAKNNPQQVDIKTPTASIAVRGTDFNMTVDETGQSLVILVPSCKDDSQVKQYELQENTCAVGKIIVSNLNGSVTLDEAFQATLVQSPSIAPSPPVIINMVESNINNNLILVKPPAVMHSAREATRTKEDRDNAALEDDAVRKMMTQSPKSHEETEEAHVMRMMEKALASGCNPIINVCVVWEHDVHGIQSKGNGIAFRITPDKHYAEVKTEGENSNTTVNINQEDSPATRILGDGSPGGSIINIIQRTGVRK